MGCASVVRPLICLVGFYVRARVLGELDMSSSVSSGTAGSMYGVKSGDKGCVDMAAASGVGHFLEAFVHFLKLPVFLVTFLPKPQPQNAR